MRVHDLHIGVLSPVPDYICAVALSREHATAMSKKERIYLEAHREWSRKRVLSLAISIALQDDEEEWIFFQGVKRPRTHAFWMSPFLHARTDASQRNTFAKLESDFIRLGCISAFSKSTRMPPGVYRELLDRVTPLITYQDTNWRRSIKPEERLSLTIRYLTRGDSVTSLYQGYLVGESTVLPLVRDTCRAIYSALSTEFLKTPATRDDWLELSKLFHDRWNMPHVLGAIDGKHVRIKKPAKSGSLYYNYKHFYSVVLFAMVDADYRFRYVDVGAEGRASDSSLWKFSDFFRDINSEENPLEIPEPTEFPGYRGKLPYYFIGDDAFEMSLRLMKPFPSSTLTFPQRIFNYRLSRARRVVENAFGILATRFRILRREIEMEPEHAAEIVMACIVLHNFLRERAAAAYLPKDATDWEDKDYNQHRGIWRGEAALPGGEATHVRNRSWKVKQMRARLADWCITREGELMYQYNLVLGNDFFFER